MAEDSHTITRLLLDWRSRNMDAAARLIELVYGAAPNGFPPDAPRTR
jgi:hypothetical protein